MTGNVIAPGEVHYSDKDDEWVKEWMTNADPLPAMACGFSGEIGQWTSNKNAVSCEACRKALGLGPLRSLSE
jgi:hypothetical protein